jgi:hypothetical protein
LTRLSGRCSSDINWAMIDLVSRPEMTPLRARLLDIAVNSTAGRDP